ncbi:membrane protein [Streptacidiphilus jiangxiensis]|nr:membrane protein [Streptacidiphilus jiangxiensis]
MAGRYGSAGAARSIMVVTDVVAGILGLWIVLYVLDANPSNDFAHWVHSAADWLSAWAHDLFTPSEGWLRTLFNYGIPAVLYLFVGHTLAGRLK